METLISKLTAKDLPNDDLQCLIEAIGIDSVRKLLLSCRGMSFYIPLKLPAAYNRKYILENYRKDLNNVRGLAKDLGITQKTVWKILSEKWPSKKYG